MNVSKAIEISMATVLRTCGDLGADVAIRAWQSLARDGSWDATQDRTFPLVDVRCSPPQTNADQVTLTADCALLCGTQSSDDKGHAQISALYEAVQTVADTLYTQFHSGVETGTEIALFLATMATEAGSAFQFSGFSFGTSLAPYNDGGANMIGITLTVHYTRSDL